MNGPLKGIRVLEVGHLLAGPYCGLLLADLGADVIKIEPPDGDIARRVSPRFVGPHNEYFLSLNRDKRSVVIDLACAEGQQTLHRLVKTAHGLVANLRPSALENLGLTYAVLGQFNPKLVCVALTGFGLTGSYTNRPAYDYIIQAMTGVMAITGQPESQPTKTGYSVVDNSAGIMGALGFVAKLVEGKGGQVDIAMRDVMLSQLNYIASASLNGGMKAERHRDSAHPFIVPAQLFPAKSGWLVLFISHDKFWNLFCREAGRPDWIEDPRFATMSARRENRELVVRAVGELLMGDDAVRWSERLVPLGVVAAPVTSLEDALASTITAERHMVVEIESAGASMKTIGNPIKTSNGDDPHLAPPLLGEHNRELIGPIE